MARLTDVRRIALSLPRATENVVREYTKFRVSRIVFASVSPDETRLGFAYDRLQREALVAAEPAKFELPVGGDLRYNWVIGRLPVLDRVELAELILDAWQFAVPAKVARDFLAGLPADWTSSVHEANGRGSY